MFNIKICIFVKIIQIILKICVFHCMWISFKHNLMRQRWWIWIQLDKPQSAGWLGPKSVSIYCSFWQEMQSRLPNCWRMSVCVKEEKKRENELYGYLSIQRCCVTPDIVPTSVSWIPPDSRSPNESSTSWWY